MIFVPAAMQLSRCGARDYKCALEARVSGSAEQNAPGLLSEQTSIEFSLTAVSRDVDCIEDESASGYTVPE